MDGRPSLETDNIIGIRSNDTRRESYPKSLRGRMKEYSHSDNCIGFLQCPSQGYESVFSSFTLFLLYKVLLRNPRIAHNKSLFTVCGEAA